MGDFLLRKCDAAGSGPAAAGEERMLSVEMSSATGSGGCKTRRIPHGAEQEGATSTGPEEQGFRICHKRARTCIDVPPRPASSSFSGNVAPAGSILECDEVESSRCTAASDSSSSSDADEVEAEPQDEMALARDSENHRLLLQGMVAVSDEGEEKERLCVSHPITLTGEHSSLESSSVSTVASALRATCSSSSSSDLEDEEPLAASRSGELESTSANTTPAPGSRPVAVAPPGWDEIEAFFAKAEDDLRRGFASKYNYDIAKDTPLEGRYEWVRIKP